MGLKRMNWQEYLYGTYERLQEDQTTMRALAQNIRIHNHTYGIVNGASVLATTPAADLEVHAQVGWVVDPAGKEIILSEIFDVDLTAYATGGATVYIVAEFDETQATPYTIAETGEVKYAYYEETPTVTAQTAAPSGNQVELARVVVTNGAVAISDAATPLSPGNDEINLKNRVYSYVRSTWIDNQPARFGSGQDASVYYDGSDLIIDPSVLGSGRVLVGATGTKTLVAYLPYPADYIYGLRMSPYSYDEDGSIIISSGGARDSTNVDNLDTNGAVKQVGVAWAVGIGGQGALDAGSLQSNTLYAVWLIKRPDTGVVDHLVSASFTAPTMPANYTLKRLIGAFKTDGTTDIVSFRQSGDQFEYVGNADTKPPTDINDDAMADGTWKTGTLISVPPHCRAHIAGQLINTAATSKYGKLWIRPRTSDALQSWPVQSEKAFAVISMDAVFDEVGARGSLMMNSAQQIDYACSQADGDATVYITVLGFEMLTRRDPQ